MDTLKYRESHDKLGGNLEDSHMKTRTGALSPTGIREDIPRSITQFDLIREWAQARGLYNSGDPKTQALKLVEEVGETCRAILKEDFEEVVDKLLKGGGILQVGQNELSETLKTLVESKETRETIANAGREVIKENQGATQKYASLIKKELNDA